MQVIFPTADSAYPGEGDDSQRQRCEEFLAATA
jgi:hypothetical protein